MHEIDNHCRHRGSDENDAPLLGDGQAAAGDGEVVIGGKEHDQADGKASDRLGDTEAIKPQGAEASPRQQGF